MASRVRYDHRELTQARIRVISDPAWRYKRLVGMWGGLALALMLAAFGLRAFEDRLAPEAYVSRLRDENGELRDALGKARFDRDVELATRGELERQVVALNDELKQAREELAFLKSAAASVPRGEPPAAKGR